MGKISSTPKWGLSRRQTFGLGLLVWGCAPPRRSAAAEDSGYAKRVRSFQEIRRKNVIIQQWDLSCGAASLATILRYQHDDPVSEREIARAMLQATNSELVRQRLGFSLLDLKRYAKARGYLAEGYAKVTLADLQGMAPAILPIRLLDFDHFVVFRGLGQGRAVLADSAYGVRTMPAERFLRVWRNRIAFVVRRNNGRPTPNLLAVPDEDLLLVPDQAVRIALP